VGQLPFPLAAAPTALSPGGWLTRSRATSLPPFQTAVTGPVAISNGGSKLVLTKFETTIYFGKIVEKIIKKISLIR
jgi:hypothetical protein